MKGKKKKFNQQRLQEKIRRDNEIKEYGKLLSLRPSKIHNSKKVYKRSNNKSIELDYENY